MLLNLEQLFVGLLVPNKWAISVFYQRVHALLCPAIWGPLPVITAPQQERGKGKIWMPLLSTVLLYSPCLGTRGLHSVGWRDKGLLIRWALYPNEILWNMCSCFVIKIHLTHRTKEDFSFYFLQKAWIIIYSSLKKMHCNISSICNRMYCNWALPTGFRL